MGGKKETTIGYKYSIGMHLVVCHGPVDEVQDIIVGERSAYSTPITASSIITIDKPDLFGGEKKEGGVVGVVDVHFGEAGQTKNNYLMAQLGPDIPAFRGVLSLILNQVYLTAMSRYPKPIWVKVKRLAATGWYDAKKEIAGVGIPTDVDYIPNGSANPAHIIYECLTNKDWGLGLPTSIIDNASFMATADQLYTENFGLSLLYSQQNRIEKFIQTILGYINGILYNDNSTGKFVLKLVRKAETAEINSSEQFDEFNISELSKYERPSYAELINEVILKYRPQGWVVDSALTVQNLAAIEAEQGVVSQTVNYTGIDNATIATRIAIRELNQYSTPLAKVSFICNRSGWAVVPGDVIRLSWESLGIANMVIRVFSVNYGTLKNGEIIIEGTEDIYSLPETAYLTRQPSGWEDPVRAPTPALFQKIFETNYYDIQTTFEDSVKQAITETSAFVEMATAIPQGLGTASYQLFSDEGSAEVSYVFKEDSPYTPTAELVGNITPIVNSITYINADTLIRLVQVGQALVIDDEILRIDSVNLVAKSIGVGRGCLDTVPSAHTTGARIWFTGVDLGNDSFEYLDGDTLHLKPLVQTDIAVLPIGSASSSELLLVGRQNKPYPPANLLINTTQYPSVITGSLALTWAHRDRTQQVTGLIDTLTASIGPETGVGYKLLMFNENNTLINQISSQTGASYTYSDEAIDTGITVLQPTGISTIATPVVTTDYDVDFYFVGFLLHFNGTDLSTSFPDVSSRPKLMTSINGAAISTSNFKYGTASLSLDGTNKYVKTTSFRDLIIGLSDFSIELSFYITSFALDVSERRSVFSQDGIITIGCEITGEITVILLNVDVLTSSTSVTLSTWTDVEITRIGGTLYIFIDGILRGSVANSDNLIGIVDTLIGTKNPTSGHFEGEIDEVRFTKGLGRHSTAFTPRTTEFPSITGSNIQIATTNPFGSVLFDGTDFLIQTQVINISKGLTYYMLGSTLPSSNSLVYDADASLFGAPQSYTKLGTDLLFQVNGWFGKTPLATAKTATSDLWQKQYYDIFPVAEAYGSIGFSPINSTTTKSFSLSSSFGVVFSSADGLNYSEPSTIRSLNFVPVKSKAKADGTFYYFGGISVQDPETLAYPPALLISTNLISFTELQLPGLYHLNPNYNVTGIEFFGVFTIIVVDGKIFKTSDNGASFTDITPTPPSGRSGWFETIAAGASLIAFGTGVNAISTDAITWVYSDLANSLEEMRSPVLGGSVLSVKTSFRSEVDTNINHPLILKTTDVVNFTEIAYPPLDSTTPTSPTEVPTFQKRLNGNIRFELSTVRGTVESLQKYNLSVDRAGYGYNYGNYYGGI